MLSLAVIIVLSYLVGSIPASVWISRWFYGVEIREHGSGNAGATNVFRILGWKAGAITTLVDIGKGVLAASLIASIRLDDLPAGIGAWEIETGVRLVAGLVAVVGHMFPVWAGFRGGKGVSTSAGVLFAITPSTMLIVTGVFAMVLLSSRYVSLASILAAVSLPTTLVIRRYALGTESLDASLLILGILLAAGVIMAHRPNIKRLLSGTENRVRSFKPGPGRLHQGQTE